jgi:hypothetical protein
MMWRKQLYTGLLFLPGCSFLAAQRILYSPFIETRSAAHWEVAGKAGDYYWFRMENPLRPSGRTAMNREAQSFVIYDSRMNPVRTVIPPPVRDTQIKEYFICSNGYFDRLILLAAHEKTILLLDRYSADGTRLYENGRIVGSFPFSEGGNSILLARSEDQNRILVLGFQSLPSSPPRLHTILFDPEWNSLYYRKYEHPFITQPLLQDDFTCYPIENFTSSPLKLANDGRWFMLSPSRMNYNYLLFDFNNSDTGFTYKEIPLPPSSGMEDLALSIDNEKEAAFAAVLSKFRYTALKNVEAVHYLFTRREFDFDSSYRFSTLAGVQLKNENLVHESLIALPKKGFMLLKEYGRALAPSYEDVLSDNPWDLEALFTTHSISSSLLLPAINRDGYTRFGRLGGIRLLFDRGDLNLFYFPAVPGDSCWSGIIDKEQVTELNSPDLSYLTLPVSDRIFFFYNSFFGNEGQYGSTTILDDQGNLQTEGGAAFWKFRNTLDFQRSRQITGNEVAIPYANFMRHGFAIIRF